MKTFRYKYINIFWAVMLLLPLGSCDFDDVNIDPESLSSVDLNLVLPSAITQVGFNNGAVASRNPGIIMQYFTGTDAQQLQYTSYNMPDNTFNNLWRTGLYGGAMKDLDFIIRRAEEQDAPYYAGIAKVLMANSLGLATEFFGDVPYSNAFQGEDGNLKPAYDTQEEIFASIFTLLDGAIADLATDGGVIQPSGDDLIFGGDPNAWSATASALKARYYLTLSKRDPANYSRALAALENSFTSNADNANLAFESTVTGGNPLWQFHSQRSNTIVLAPYFLGILNDDPRLSLIQEPGTDTGFSPNTFWAAQNSIVPIINYAETKFIQAEALKQTGGSDAEVLQALQEGIQANMDEMGVDAGERDVYLAMVIITSVESIINEKYKSLYPQNIAWTDYRRTGFPAITPSSINAEGLNPGGDIPERFIYPNSEKELNEENVQNAIQRQGSDLMNETLWAFE